ncbi:Cell division control protein 11 [Coemansia erecta]|nr:Cell division control protein 11 [Coemansia erecta]
MMAGQPSASDRDKARLEWHQRKLSCRRHTPESLNVMVVGRRGVGKSTLLQTICDSFYSLHIESLTEGNRAMFPSASYKETAVSGEEVLDPFCVFDTLSGTNVIRRCKVRIRELLDSQPITIEFVDTPGIDGTDEQKAAATINEICGEIERRLQATLDEEQRTQRSKSSFASAHIHAIIYILPPPVYHSADTDSHGHRLEKAANIVTELDLRAIRRFSQYANVIPAIGKCDTIEFSDRNILKDGSFYRALRDLLVPDRIFDFSDTPNTPYKEPYEEVKAFRRAFLRKLPFLVCGSKHVDEWQNMRLPEYLCSSESRISITDWRVLKSKHNRDISRPQVHQQFSWFRRAQFTCGDESASARTEDTRILIRVNDIVDAVVAYEVGLYTD